MKLNNLLNVNKVSTSPTDYRIGIMSSSGMGKTTTAFKLMEKWCGEDYIILDTGLEGGLKALEGARSITTNTWEDFLEAVNAIIFSKINGETNIKMVVIDTVDELQRSVEKYVIDKYNQTNHDGKVANSINDAGLNFGAGLSQSTSKVLHVLSRLEDVGITPFLVFHSQVREVDDEISDKTYKELSSKLGTSTFTNYITKLDVLGTIYMDREIKEQSKMNFVGKLEKTGKIEDEKRIIVFRDETSSVRSKSRLENIVEAVEFTADNIDKAIRDAIKNATKLSDEDYKKRVKEVEENNNKINVERNEKQNELVKLAILTKFHNIMSSSDLSDVYEAFVEKVVKSKEVNSLNDIIQDKEIKAEDIYDMVTTVANKTLPTLSITELKEL